MEIDNAVENRITKQAGAKESDKLEVLARPPESAQPEAREVEYTPYGHLGMGFSAWREMVLELVESRELTWRLFLRDFSARYKQSLLGYTWAIVPAVLTVLTFSLLNKSKVLQIENTALPYPLFLMVGMTVWQLFASGITLTTQSLVEADSMITKVNFPRETLVIAAFGQSLFEFAVRGLLLALMFVFYRIAPAWTIILLPIALIPLYLFTLGLGMLLSFGNGIMRDVGKIVTFLLTFWMFITPVIYPAPTSGPKTLMNILNPVSPFVIAAHDLTTSGHLTQPATYVIGSVSSVLLFLLSWRIFHLAEIRLAERI